MGKVNVKSTYDEAAQRRFIVVQISSRRWVVAGPTSDDEWEYKACTKPLERAAAHHICIELNSLPRERYSQTTLDNLLN